ncbi:DUF4912 domain-containing protein [Methyloprofundus sp.]|uniref:DUF4912 domain-containing protein n=1 Tax=Methyloprofundus sp. TaxID=2020875 RepID=UPI003D12A7F8
MKLWQSRYNPQCKLSQQGLLDISEEITQSYAPHDNHHQPELVLMPVDPNHLYAYWNLQVNETDQTTEHVNKPLALRVYSIPELSADPSNIKLSFDIEIQDFQKQQKIPLPAAASAYSAVIGELNPDNSFSALVSSDTIHVPRENPVSESNSAEFENNLHSEQRQENVLHTESPPQASQLEDYKHNLGDNTQTIEQAKEHNLVTDINLEDMGAEITILENFKGYGYDLKVFGQNNNSSTKDHLTQSTKVKQVSKNHSGAKENSTHNKKNSSGLGHLS